MVRAIWIVAPLSAAISVILSRSGFSASQWLGIPSLVLICLGAMVSTVGIVQISRCFRSYASQKQTLGSFDQEMSRQSAVRFAGLQALAVGIMIGLGAAVASALPGVAVQAPIIAVLLAASLWALQPEMLRRRGVGEALERLVPSPAQRAIADRIPYWQRPDGGWKLTARAAFAHQASGLDQAAVSYLAALDSDGAVRPDIEQRGPTVLADAQWRAASVMPVFLASLPFAFVAWACAAWLPDAWVPRLPSPGSFIGLEAPLAAQDEPVVPLADDEARPDEEVAENGDSQAGTSDQASEEQQGSSAPADGDAQEDGNGEAVGEDGTGAENEAGDEGDASGGGDSGSASEAGGKGENDGEGEAGGEGRVGGEGDAGGEGGANGESGVGGEGEARGGGSSGSSGSEGGAGGEGQADEDGASGDGAAGGKGDASSKDGADGDADADFEDGAGGTGGANGEGDAGGGGDTGGEVDTGGEGGAGEGSDNSGVKADLGQPEGAASGKAGEDGQGTPGQMSADGANGLPASESGVGSPDDGAQDDARSQVAGAGEGAGTPGAGGAPAVAEGETPAAASGEARGTGQQSASEGQLGGMQEGAAPSGAGAGETSTEPSLSGSAASPTDIGGASAEGGAGGTVGGQPQAEPGTGDPSAVILENGMGQFTGDVENLTGADAGEGQSPAGSKAVAVIPTDEPLPPDAELVELPVQAGSTPIPDQGEDLTVGSPQAIFAEPGSAPDTIETRLDEDAVLPPDLPTGPAPQQRLPAWIYDLLNE